jgi:hypothetical protein
MSMIGFPLLLIPLAIYNIIAFLMRDVSFAAPLMTVPLTSGVAWPVTLSDVLLALGILLLLCEVIKGARPGAKYLTDHLLSLLVLGGAAAEFVMVPQFGTSTYFLLTTLALADFLSGVALRTRRGTVASTAVVSRGSNSAPAVSEPIPASIDESAPRHRREPKIGHADVTPAGPSPEVPSPGLQPGDGLPPSPDAPPR